MQTNLQQVRPPHDEVPRQTPQTLTSPRLLRRSMVGIALIVFGLLALIGTLTQSELVGLLFLPILGGSFLILGGISGRFGFFIPGGILTGLGVGTLISQELLRGASANVQSGIVVIGLALGFLAITPLCQYFARVHPFWPVLAGAALLVIGICLLIGGPALDALTLISKYFWPLVLVAVGSYLLWRVYHPTQRDRERHGPLHPQR